MLSRFCYDPVTIPDRDIEFSTVEKVEQFKLVKDENEKYGYTINIIKHIKPPVVDMSKFATIKEKNLCDDFSLEKCPEQTLFLDKMKAFLEVIDQGNIDPFENDFIATSGVFHAIMKTQFQPFHDYTIVASKLKNTIFLKFFRDDDYLIDQTKYDTTVKNKRFELQILKQILLDDKERNQNLKCSTKEESKTFNVQQVKLESKKCQSFRLLYAGEQFDFLYPENGEDNLNSSIMLKLDYNRSTKNQKQMNNYRRHTLPEWWTLSILTGIQKVITVKKNYNNKVDSFEELSLETILEECQKGVWNGPQSVAVMSIDYLYQFLDYVKNILKDETDPKNAYCFHRKPEIDLNRVQTFVECSKLPKENSVLTETFIEKFKQ